MSSANSLTMRETDPTSALAREEQCQTTCRVTWLAQELGANLGPRYGGPGILNVPGPSRIELGFLLFS